MPKDRERSEIKVTDKRMFTAEGDIREEFRDEIKPGQPSAAPAEQPPAPAKESSEQRPPAERRMENTGAPAGTNERRRSLAERGETPETPFAVFAQSLVMQAYMTLGMLRNPYQPQAKPDPVAARELIDILTMLQEKTKGNLTEDEDEFLTTHLGQLKLAYVQVTKNIS